MGETPHCSRAQCRAPAVWSVNWRNPRIHTEDRVKVWLACDDHREYLHDYLASRGFPVSVSTYEAGLEGTPGAPA